MASHRPSADLDADIARVTRAAQFVIIGSWCAAALAVAAVFFMWLYWLPRHPVG
jgi:hypothetical protein